MTSVSVEQATAFSPARQFALFDAGGLSDEQRQMLPPHGSEGAHWFYSGLGDPRALDMGPVLVQATERMLSLVEQLWADSAVRWASSILVSKLSMEDLARRLSRMRYVHTHDGQRYFFRFADSRCFMAMSSALTGGREQQLQVGWLLRQMCARDGSRFDVHGESGAEPLIFPLRLSASELDTLLEGVWPDQLLASAHELVPSLRQSEDAERQHGWMQRLCRIFGQSNVDSYPIQIDSAIRVLRSSGRLLDDPSFHLSLDRVQQAQDPARLSDAALQ